MDLVVVGGGSVVVFVLAYLIVRSDRAQHKRDLEWDALVTASERMSRKYGAPVRAREHPSLATVTRGFEACGRYFPVYERSLFSRSWRAVRPIGDAASEVGEMLRGGRA